MFFVSNVIDRHSRTVNVQKRSASDFLDIEPFAEEVERNPRTVRRWMDQPHDGLPYTWIGNRRLIHVPTAREWIFARMRNRKARRKQRAQDPKEKRT